MKMIVLLVASLSCLHVSGYLFPQKAIVPAVEEVKSTPASSFAFVRGHRQGKGIMITWGMSSNTGITSYRVESTVEDPGDPYSNWTIETTMPAGDTRSHKFLDGTAYPGFNHYRIVAVMDNNTSVTSQICTVRIVSH